MNLSKQETHPFLDSRIPYAAGYFDGEGCIWVGYTKNRSGRETFLLRLSIISGDREVLMMLSDLFGGEVRGVKSRTSRVNLFRWSKNGLQAVETLSRMEPFLIAKREQAVLVASAGWDVCTRGRGYSMSDDMRSRRFILRDLLQQAKRTNKVIVTLM